MKIFRLTGVIVLAVFIAVVWAISTFFINGWVKSGLESSGMEMNGATVSVRDVAINWLSQGLEIEQLTVANPSDLNRNRFELGRLKLDMNILELLKGKIIVDELELLDLRLDTPRKTPATLRKTVGERVEDWQWPRALEQEVSEINVQELVSKVQIQSPEKFQSFSVQLQQTQLNWNNQSQSLLDKEKIEALKTEFENAKNAVKQAKGLEKLKHAKELKTVLSKIEEEKKKINRFKKLIGNDLNNAKTQWKELQGQLDKDTELAMSIINLSPQGMKHLASNLLGEDLADWTHLIIDNIDTAKKILKSKETPQKEIAPSRRGVDFVFGNQEVLPDFWMKNGRLGGQVFINNDIGILEGRLHNWRSQLKNGQKSSAHITLTIPQSKSNQNAMHDPDRSIKGVLALAIEDPKSTHLPIIGQLSLANWPIEEWQVGSGMLMLQDVKAQIKFELSASELETNLKAVLQLSDFKVKILSNATGWSEQLGQIIANSESLELVLDFKQSQGESKLSLSSSLDQKLWDRIKQDTQQKLDATRAKIRQQIESKIADKQQTIERKLSVLSSIDSELSSQIDQLDSFKE